MRGIAIALGALTLLCGCAPAPEVDVARFDGRIPSAPPGYPALAPIEAAAPAAPRAPGAAIRATQSRAAALRARAGALRGPVISEEERARLEDARR